MISCPRFMRKAMEREMLESRPRHLYPEAIMDDADTKPRTPRTAEERERLRIETALMRGPLQMLFAASLSVDMAAEMVTGTAGDRLVGVAEMINAAIAEVRRTVRGTRTRQTRVPTSTSKSVEDT